MGYYWVRVSTLFRHPPMSATPEDYIYTLFSLTTSSSSLLFLPSFPPSFSPLLFTPSLARSREALVEVMGNVGEVGTEETANGGTDAWSSSECAASKADHLVVMVHGILGRYCSPNFGLNLHQICVYQEFFFSFSCAFPRNLGGD